MVRDVPKFVITLELYVLYRQKEIQFRHFQLVVYCSPEGWLIGVSNMEKSLIWIYSQI